MRHIANIFLLLIFIPFTVLAEKPVMLYMNGLWDSSCDHCWPSPQTLQNNHCKPKDCAVQGYYHCKNQHPPLALDDDPRLISLIKNGQCIYAPKLSMSEAESAYVNKIYLCTAILDRIAGRFNFPPQKTIDPEEKIIFLRLSEVVNHLKIPIDEVKLAMLFDAGKGTVQDRNKAMELFTQTANEGLPLAQYIVGARYAYGISVPQNIEMATYWLNKAMTTKPSNKLEELASPCAGILIARLHYIQK